MTDDDRVTCTSCVHCSVQKKRCLEDDCLTDVNQPRRCILYIPIYGHEDKRSGRDRWPDLVRQIKIAREEDLIFHFGERKRRGSPKSPNSKPRG